MWIMYSQLPNDFSEEETKILCTPLTNILKNEFKEECPIHKNKLLINGKEYLIIPAFKKCAFDSITDFEIFQSLPVLIGRIFK